MQRVRIGGSEAVFLGNDEKDVLGYAVWYTISRTLVHKDDLHAWFDKHGLSRFKPADPKHGDAFKRICSEYKEKKIDESADSETFLLLRPLETGLTRKIVLEKRKEGKKLSYNVVGEIAYDEKSRNVNYSLKTADPVVRTIVKEILDRFEREKDCYTDEHIRKTLHRILDSCNRVKLKPSGGIYLVPLDDFYWIESFSKIVEEIKKINPSNRTEIWYAPIVNTERHRRMLEIKVEDTLEEILNSAIERLLKIDSQDPSKVRQIDEIAKQIEQATRMAEKYTKMLKVSLNRTTSLLEKAERLLNKIRQTQHSQIEIKVKSTA